MSGISRDVGTYTVYEDSAGMQDRVGAFDDRRVARPVAWYQETVAVLLRFGAASVLDREADIRWSGYVAVPAKPTATSNHASDRRHHRGGLELRKGPASLRAGHTTRGRLRLHEP